MATLIIRNLDDQIKQKLRMRAAEHAISMEQEARQILAEALVETASGEVNLAQRIHHRFAMLGGVDLPLPDRHEAPRALDL